MPFESILWNVNREAADKASDKNVSHKNSKDVLEILLNHKDKDTR